MHDCSYSSIILCRKWCCKHHKADFCNKNHDHIICIQLILWLVLIPFCDWKWFLEFVWCPIRGCLVLLAIYFTLKMLPRNFYFIILVTRNGLRRMLCDTCDAKISSLRRRSTTKVCWRYCLCCRLIYSEKEWKFCELLHGMVGSLLQKIHRMNLVISSRTWFGKWSDCSTNLLVPEDQSCYILNCRRTALTSLNVFVDMLLCSA